MPKLSDYAPSGGGVELEDDIYPATIISLKIIMDGPLAAVNEWGKHSALLTVHLDDKNDQGDPVELTRKVNISFGAAGGVYSPLASLIEAAIGIKCGDKKQRDVSSEDLAGKRIRVQTKTVEGKSGGTFTNIASFLPPKRHAPPTRQQAKLDDPLDEEIPF